MCSGGRRRSWGKPWYACLARAERSALWRYRELAAPHHAAVTMPDTVTELLLQLAA